MYHKERRFEISYTKKGGGKSPQENKKTCNRYFEKGKMKFNNVKPILNLTLLNSILYMPNRGFNNVKPMLNLTLLNSILYVPNRGFNIVKPMLNLTLLNSILFVFL